MTACGQCGTENRDDARFCIECGDRIDGRLECPSCGESVRDTAAFCHICGAAMGEAATTSGPTSRTPSRPRPATTSSPAPGQLDWHRWVPYGAVAAVVVAVVAIGVFVLAGGDDDDTGAASPPDGAGHGASFDDAAAADLVAAGSLLPEASGDTEAEQLMSVLGRPDAFQLTFEVPEDGATAVRYETWYYLDLEISYEFADGALLFTVPAAAPETLTLPALQYDPLAFNTETTLADVKAMAGDPTALTASELPAELEAPLTFYVGAQLIVAFDDDDRLFSVETVPLALGEQ